MKHYLIKCTKNWADECDVHFLETFDEAVDNRYMICKNVLKHWYDSYYFGTNEGWEDGEFDYLDFTPIELSDSEYRTFKKFNVHGEMILQDFFWNLHDCLVDKEIIKEDDDLFEMSEENFKRAVESYESMLDE